MTVGESSHTLFQKIEFPTAWLVQFLLPQSMTQGLDRLPPGEFLPVSSSFLVAATETIRLLIYWFACVLPLAYSNGRPLYEKVLHNVHTCH